MSSEISISLTNISKVYAIFNRPEDRLKQMIWRNKRKYYHEFHAVNNLTLSVRKGQTVGIVGRNGSGKSTILQMICGTLAPTSGDISVRGRVCSTFRTRSWVQS